MANAADYLIERLLEWGVRRIFGYPGDGINGLINAVNVHSDKIEFVQVRHEEMAAFMATAHAKWTGELGVCMATSGPGAIHLLNGLYDGKMDHMPVLCIVGQAATTALGGEYQQEVDLNVLFKDVCSEYLVSVVNPEQVQQAVDRAVRIAIATRSVTGIIVPKDVQEMKAVTEQPHKHNAVMTGIGYSKPSIVPKPQDLQRAADVLNAGKKVAMLIGAGAMNATDEVLQTADLLGCGVAKALLGKAAAPDTVPFVTGTIGLLGTRPSVDMMADCDTLFMIGSCFPYVEFLPKPGQARGVQIDVDGRRLGMRYDFEVNLVGDAAETLRALMPLLQRKSDRSWQEKLIADRKEWEQVNKARGELEGNPLNPQVLFDELSPRLPDNVILSGDAGTPTNWSARHLVIRPGMKWSLSGMLATMGPAVPYAAAAKFAFPDRVAIGMTGDGAMQMNGINCLITIAKYWKNWSDPRLIILVLNNQDLNQVTWELRVESGDPRFLGSQKLPDFPYASFAESLGLMGIRVSKREEVGPAWDRALAADRPVVYEAMADPNMFMIPPHVSKKQAEEFARAMVKGDPNELGVLIGSVKELVAGALPSLVGIVKGGNGGPGTRSGRAQR